eukprot:gene4314-7557_t
MSCLCFAVHGTCPIGEACHFRHPASSGNGGFPPPPVDDVDDDIDASGDGA